mgnify:CR=1 FL=1
MTVRIGVFGVGRIGRMHADIIANETLIDDASGKNQTKHSGILHLPADLNQSIALLRKTLAEARREGKKMIPFGARHSMGKQSIQENAIHIDLKNLRK